MPTDTRRINGPENTVPYFLYSDKSKKSYAEYVQNLLNSCNKREDGREPSEHRRIYMKTGVISQAKGSAYIEYRNTKVICSAFDPREIPNRSEFCINGELFVDFRFATFANKRRSTFRRDPEEVELSDCLKRALEPAVCRHEFPNFQVDVYALVLQNDGSALAAAVTCASLALADASVPMYDLVTAASVVVYNNIELMDPTVVEESVCTMVPPLVDAGNCDERGQMTLAFMGNLKQVVNVSQCGVMEVERITQLTDRLVEQCLKIYPLSQRCLVKTLLTNLNEQQEQALLTNLNEQQERLGKENMAAN